MKRDYLHEEPSYLGNVDVTQNSVLGEQWQKKRYEDCGAKRWEEKRCLSQPEVKPPPFF